jgi:hypothetical protein
MYSIKHVRRFPVAATLALFLLVDLAAAQETSSAQSSNNEPKSAVDNRFTATAERPMYTGVVGKPTAMQGPTVKGFLYDAFGPGTWIAAGILAGRDQARNHNSDTRLHGEPPEWGQGAEGYGDRYASRFGQIAISQTVRYGTGALLHEDVTYHKCQCSGFLPRFSHAFISSYTAKTKSGNTVFSLPNVIGPLAAGQIAVAGWYPSRFDQRQGLRLSVPMLMGAPIRNTVREFLGR